MKTKYLTLSAVLLATSMAGYTAFAETVRTKTYVDTADVIEERKINFSAFDVNEDGIYTKDEVGEKLFYIFDQDGNEVIDNMEWDNRSMYTITPMEKETYKFVDYDDDGIVEQSTYTYETFYKASGLIRFDQDQDGLSAAEFIDTGYQELDTDESNMIELDEWEKAYIERTSPKSSDPDNYN